MLRFHFLLALIALTSFVGCSELEAPRAERNFAPPTPQPRQLDFNLASVVRATTSLEAHAKETADESGSAEPAAEDEPKLLGQPLPERMAAANGTEPLNLYGPTYAGKEFYWSDYRGRAVMVVFWASWCPGCKDFLPQLEGLSNFIRHPNFEIVTVNVDEDPAAGRAFLNTLRFPFETIMDGEQDLNLSQEYPTPYVPTVVIVNKAGNIAKLDIQKADFAKELKVLLNEPFAVNRPEIRNAIKKTAGSPRSETEDTETDEEGLVEAKSGAGKKGRGYGDDPLTYALKARWTTAQKLVFDVQIPKAMSLFQATNDRLPNSHAEFMKEIIEASSIPLPELPAGDEYVYSPSQGKLMIRKAM